MPAYRFYQLDVFTDQPLGGNPLAVFPEATGLDTPIMQRIAREMNLSETTFVFPPDDPAANYKVRIFTPTTEMPFAGHPVVGTHWLLAHIGHTLLRSQGVTVTFELNVGLRSARLDVIDGKVARVLMDHQKPTFGSPATPDQVARVAEALGVPTAAITDTHLPVQWVSSGIRQLFAPIRSLADISRIDANRVNAGLLAELCAEIDPDTHANQLIMAFSTETSAPGIDVHTRAFGPGLGILEDPATGSASGGLGAYLIENKIFPATLPTTRLITEQGVEMGRPSRVEIEIDGTAGSIDMIRIGGKAVVVIEGTLTL